jgi:formamidopyrimidine-DNA glycosylase
MPELPEVETIRRCLRRQVTGKRIASVRFSAKRVTMHPGPSEASRCLSGATVRDVARRGKYLVFSLDGGRELVMHLGMSGQVHVGQGPEHRHERMRLQFSDGQTLSFVDTRRFGRLCVTKDGDRTGPIRGIARLGPEPIDKAFDSAYLASRLSGRKAPVKGLLLDQSVACGVGNIYSDEALYRARIRPDRRAGSLKPIEVSRLSKALHDVLVDGIRWRGTTAKDGGYVLPDGSAGAFQNRLCAYGREGERCRRRGCGGVIRRQRIGGRSAHFCPVCQK